MSALENLSNNNSFSIKNLRTLLPYTDLDVKNGLQLQKIVNLSKEELQENVIRYHRSISWKEIAKNNENAPIYKIQKIEDTSSIHKVGLFLSRMRFSEGINGFLLIGLDLLSIYLGYIECWIPTWSKTAGAILIQRPFAGHALVLKQKSVALINGIYRLIKTYIKSSRSISSYFFFFSIYFVSATIVMVFLKRFNNLKQLQLGYQVAQLKRNNESSREVTSQEEINNFNSPLLYKIQGAYIEISACIKRLFDKELSKEGNTFLIPNPIYSGNLSASDGEALIQYICDFFVISKEDFLNCLTMNVTDEEKTLLKTAMLKKLEAKKNECIDQFNLQKSELISRIDQRQSLSAMNIEENSPLDQIRDEIGHFELVYTEICTKFGSQISSLAEQAVKKIESSVASEDFDVNDLDDLFKNFCEADKKLYLQENENTDLDKLFFYTHGNNDKTYFDFKYPIIQDILQKAVLAKLKEKYSEPSTDMKSLISKFDEKVVKATTMTLRSLVSSHINEQFPHLEDNVFENSPGFEQAMVRAINLLKTLKKTDRFLELIPPSLRQTLKDELKEQDAEAGEESSAESE